MPAPSENSHCQYHPRAAAGWFCPACDAKLCPDCAVVESVASTDLLSCARCGGAVEEWKVHRSHAPFSRRLLGAWKYPLKKSGLMALLAVGAVVALSRGVSGMLPLLPGLVPICIWLGSFWGSIFWIVRGTSMGAEHFTAPDFHDVHHDLVRPAIRGTVATALLWLPAILFALLVEDLDLPDALFWVVVVLATVLYAPMALIIAATGESTLSLLNPFKVIGIGKRLGSAYLTVAAWMVPLAMVHGALMLVAAQVYSLSIPLVASVLAEGISLYVPFVMARMLGLLLYVHGDRVGYGIESEFYEPALPGVKPRGKKRAARVPAQAQPEAHQPAPRPRFIELEPEPAPRPAAAPEPLEAQVVKAVETNALDQALELYRRLPENLASLPAASHVAVGQKAAAAGDYPLAIRALKQVAQLTPEDPLAPKACVILARLYGERLGDAASAQKLYRHVVGRYPGTDAARFAQSRLTAA
ncbi:hypothetical protein [Archangium violaceum]|uniref:B box-type domain-containing protein n=1 Tax=Archangium violaceum Cb vi76 TaxID=1406225 RepID=A0A084SSP4_9BACT|nr:hypothetical protein [Archangium violaceum]KFA91479.1 hypothetical protein Q664_21975 [Archangium violaceum Cb vi76]